MTSTDNLISLLNQLQAMESTVTDFLMETVLRFQSLTDSKLFLFIESGGKERQRRYCGTQELVRRFESQGFCRQSADSFVELNSNVKALIDSAPDKRRFASELDQGNPPKRCKVGATYYGVGSKLTSKSLFHGPASVSPRSEVYGPFSRETSLSPSDVKEETCEFKIIDDDDEDEDEADDFQEETWSETLYPGEVPHTASYINKDQSETKFPNLDQNTASCEHEDRSGTHRDLDQHATATEKEDRSETNYHVHGSDQHAGSIDSTFNQTKKSLGDRKSEQVGLSSATKKASLVDEKLAEVLASEDGKKTIRLGRTNPINPIPTFEDPIPPRSAFEFDRVVFMPSRDGRPLLVFQGNLYRIKRAPTSRGGRTSWFCINQQKIGCPAKMYTSRNWPCRPEDVEHKHSVLDHLCSSTMQDVYVRRANAEMVFMAKNTEEKPRQIVKDTLGKEPEHVLNHVKGYASLKRKIELSRTKARKTAATETDLDSRGGSTSKPKD